jgi:GNAT superfamily N-acetyltransferase
LTNTEIPRVLSLMARLYAQDTIPWDEDRSRKAIQELLADTDCGGTWLLQVDGTTAGYLVLTICFSLEFHGRYALLDELFVEEEWRRQGVGSEALRFAEEQCRVRGLKALRLEVDRKNVRAQELYRRRGFELHDRYLMTRWVGTNLC